MKPVFSFKIDENLPDEAGELLESAGHDAVSVRNQGLGGAADATIDDVIREEKRILITLDQDFADIRAYPPDGRPGIIVLRLQRQGKQEVLDVLSRLIPIMQSEPIVGRLWIVEERGIRIRGDVD